MITKIEVGYPSNVISMQVEYPCGARLQHVLIADKWYHRERTNYVRSEYQKDLDKLFIGDERSIEFNL